MALLLLVLRAAQASGQTPATPSGPPPEVWPDAATMTARKDAAERRPLFASKAPLPFSLIADFNAVQSDRDPLSTKTYPATLAVVGSSGAEVSIPVRIRTRGHSRRKPTMCTFAPLRIEFSTDPIGTPFEGQKNIKLGTHCREMRPYEEYVHREYSVYQLHNVVTPHSFRARLASAQYVNVKNGRPIATKAAFFLEDDDDVAARIGGRATDLLRISYPRAEPRAAMLTALFEFMIGNTDMSMMTQHNIIIVRTPDGKLIPVPYDFDYSGIVDTRYARADPKLGISSVRERTYRGPCRTPEQLDPYLAHFRDARTNLSAVYQSIPGLTPGYVRSAQKYLDQFFAVIDDQPRFRRMVTGGCLDGM